MSAYELDESVRERIRAEEAFRALASREHREGAAEAPSPTRGERLWGFLNSQVGGWLLGTVLVGVVGTFWSCAQDRLHREERDLARVRAQAEKDVDVVTRVLPQLSRVGTPESRLAAQLVGHLKETGAIDGKFADALDGVLQKVAQENIDAASKAAVQDRAPFQAVANAALTAFDARVRDSAPGPQGASLTTAPKRVYLQIAAEAQRAGAEQLRSKLQSDGFNVPGIENVGTKAPDATEVRYFNDVDQSSAEEALGILRRAPDVSSASAKRLNMNVQPGKLEIWIGRNDLVAARTATTAPATLGAATTVEVSVTSTTSTSMPAQTTKENDVILHVGPGNQQLTDRTTRALQGARFNVWPGKEIEKDEIPAHTIVTYRTDGDRETAQQIKEALRESLKIETIEVRKGGLWDHLKPHRKGRFEVSFGKDAS